MLYYLLTFYPNSCPPQPSIYNPVLCKLKSRDVPSNHLSPTVPIFLWATSAALGTIHRQPLTPLPSMHDLFTCPNHLSLAFYILSSTEATPYLASDIFISNPIPPSMLTHPSQHSHFHNFHLLSVRVLNWPTLRPI